MRKLFDTAVIIKGIDGVLEMIGSVILFFLKPQTISGFFDAITQHELAEDPNDLIANSIVKFTHQFSIHTEWFAAFYLLAHGIIKIVLVFGLLKNKRWAYPFAVVFLSVFIIYQMYRISYSHSLVLIGLTLYDILVTYLIIREYRYNIHFWKNE